MAAAPAEETKKIQIYSSSTSSSSARKVTPFWKEKYEKDAKKYWDLFYKRHKDKFFKDRHYFDKEWGRYFKAREGEKLVVLEVGCGAGNSIFPLLSTYHGIFIHACDFSPRAIDLVKAHKDFSCDQINAFVCDITSHNLNETIPSSSVDIVTMVFVLSAVAPEKMTLVLQNIRKVLKPNGRVLFRDYATGDLAQERLTCKEQQISENFYVRGDGTRAYYFPEDFLTSLFTENGFHALEVGVCNKQVENRSLELVMNRRWIQAVYSASLPNYSDLSTKLEEVTDDHGTNKISTEDSRIHDEIDISDSIAQMFDVSPSNDVVTISPFWRVFNISNNQSASSPIRMGSVSGAWNSIDKVFVTSCQPSVKPLGSGAKFLAKVSYEQDALAPNPESQLADSWTYNFDHVV